MGSIEKHKVTHIRGGVKNSHILIQHSAEFGVRLLLIKIPDVRSSEMSDRKSRENCRELGNVRSSYRSDGHAQKDTLGC